MDCHQNIFFKSQQVVRPQSAIKIQIQSSEMRRGLDSQSVGLCTSPQLETVLLKKGADHSRTDGETWRLNSYQKVPHDMTPSHLCQNCFWLHLSIDLAFWSKHVPSDPAQRHSPAKSPSPLSSWKKYILCKTSAPRRYHCFSWRNIIGHLCYASLSSQASAMPLHGYSNHFRWGGFHLARDLLKCKWQK